LFPDDLPTRPWAYNYFFPFHLVQTEEDMYTGALLSCLDMMRSGTTCFIDATVLSSNRHLDSAIQGVTDSGLRGILGRGLCDKRPRDVPPFYSDQWVDRIFYPSTEAAIGEMRDAMKRWTNQPAGRVRGWATILGLLGWCTDELFVTARRVAEEYGVGTSYHIASFLEEARESERQLGVWPIRHLHRLGALGPNVLLIHAVAVADNEVELLAETGTKIAHCPGAALHLAKGASRLSKVPEMLASGVTVSLGVDGVCASGTFDMVRQMFVVAGLFKDARMDPTVIPAETALEMATINGAKAIMMEREIGSIEPGKRADLVIFDTERPEWVPMHHPVRTLVYSANGASVKTVLVDGRVLMRDGKVASIDERKVLDAAREAGERIARRAGLTSNSRWPLIDTRSGES
jgi:cytosine/adenosine deaminase-related metal-dependent hydrolase